MAKERRMLLLFRGEQRKPWGLTQCGAGGEARGGWRSGLLRCRPRCGTRDCG